MTGAAEEPIRVLRVPEGGERRGAGADGGSGANGGGGSSGGDGGDGGAVGPIGVGGDSFAVAVETAAEPALERLRLESFDCVVAGYDLPDRTGIDLLRDISDRDPDVPFVLATAAGSEAVASEAIAAGVTDYVRLDTPQEEGGDGAEALRARVRAAVDRDGDGDRSDRERDKRRLETLIGNLPGFVYRCRNAPGWPMELVRGESLSITGYTTEELASDAVVWGEQVVHPDDKERVWQVVQGAMDAGEEFEVTYRIRARDGEVRWVWERGCLVESTVDGTAVLEGFITDVTERKEYEAELERQNRELEAFTSVVSHDLRNPLSVAKGRVELARERYDDEHLEHAAAAHERMEERIEQLLTLARNGERVTETEPVDLAAAVDSCWAGSATGDATLAVDADLTVEADRERLVQLLENLVRNALDHGGEDVAVTAGELDDAAGFFVADDGPGIPEDVRDQVFDAGFTTTDGGTGFGLGIVSRIAEAHGWAVDAAASEGGARIEVRTDPAP